jgi:hypothetical protein
MSWHEDTPYNPNAWMQDPLLSAWYERVNSKSKIKEKGTEQNETNNKRVLLSYRWKML